MNATIEEALKVFEMQEEILQFSHFTNEDAWELGNLIVATLKKKGVVALTTICLNNGFRVFQYGMNGTTPYNERVAKQIHNTVKLMEKSSLNVTMMLQQSNELSNDHLLCEKEYALCGGGFPIRIEEVGVIGSVVITGVNPVLDHDLLVKCIGKYLHVDEIPRLKLIS